MEFTLVIRDTQDSISIVIVEGANADAAVESLQKQYHQSLLKALSESGEVPEEIRQQVLRDEIDVLCVFRGNHADDLITSPEDAQTVDPEEDYPSVTVVDDEH